MHSKRFIFILFLIFSLPLSAKDKVLDNEVTVFNETFSWQLMGSISAVYDESLIKGQDQEEAFDYVRAALLLDLYYKGFFIQSDHRRPSALLQGAEIGYQLKATRKWELDIISRTYVTEIDPKDIIDDADKDIPTLDGLATRESGQGIALRYSRYHHNSVFSVDLATLAPLSNANGWIADAFYSYTIPYRNWDIYLNTGYTFYSEKVTDYFYGVDQNEVSSARPLYKAKSGHRIQLEIFAQYPLSQRWSFSGGITQSFYSDSIKDSPLVDTKNLTQVMLGAIYVF